MSNIYLFVHCPDFCCIDESEAIGIGGMIGADETQKDDNKHITRQRYGVVVI